MPTLAFKRPLSVSLPAGTGRKGEGRDRTPVQVPRAARQPGTTWQPRKWFLALPGLCDEHDLESWLAWAKPGCRVAYHAGELPRDRRADPGLDLLARALIFRSDALVIAFSRCGYSRACWKGSNDVTLAQIRIGPGSWLYAATRAP